MYKNKLLHSNLQAQKVAFLNIVISSDVLIQQSGLMWHLAGRKIGKRPTNQCGKFRRRSQPCSSSRPLKTGSWTMSSLINWLTRWGHDGKPALSCWRINSIISSFDGIQWIRRYCQIFWHALIILLTLIQTIYFLNRPHVIFFSR